MKTNRARKWITLCMFIMTILIITAAFVPSQVLAETAKPEILISADTIRMNGGSIDVTIANAKNPTGEQDWIGLYEEFTDWNDNVYGRYLWYKYMPELGIKNGNGSFKFNSLADIFDDKKDQYIAGRTYRFVLFYNNSYNIEAVSDKFTVMREAVTVNAAVDKKTHRAVITGKISSGEGKQVNIVIINPSNKVVYVDQITSSQGGNYRFTYAPDKNIKGEYKVKVSGQEVTVPAETGFIYKPVKGS